MGTQSTEGQEARLSGDDPSAAIPGGSGSNAERQNLAVVPFSAHHNLSLSSLSCRVTRFALFFLPANSLHSLGVCLSSPALLLLLVTASSLLSISP